MTNRMVKAALMMICLVSLATATVKPASRPAVGTWKLNVQKSSYGSMPAPKFEQLVVTTDKADALKWSLKGIGADGKSYISSYDGPIDGKDHAMMDSAAAGSTIAYTRNASGVQWVIRDKSGAVMETGASDLSADGKTLTLRGTTQGPNGKESFVSVFERIQ